jgi:hypothetical protein
VKSPAGGFYDSSFFRFQRFEGKESVLNYIEITPIEYVKDQLRPYTRRFALWAY